MPKRQKISALFVGAELAPLVKVGGLADVMGALPKALVRLGVELKIIIPFYGSIDRDLYKIIKVEENLSINVAGSKERFSLYKAFLPGTKIPVYLIKHRLFNGRDVYFGSGKYFKGSKTKQNSPDVERLSIFNQMVVEVIYARRWQVDIIHHHDWHTGLLPTYIDEYSIKYPDFPNIKTLFTIHNLASQGIAGLDIVDYASLDRELTPALMEDYYDKDGQVLDLMKIAILSADRINTVSPTYAKEILRAEYGEGLDKYLWRRKKYLAGILNGIDIELFNPKTDKYIFKKYSLKDHASGKAFNKSHLQARLKLPVEDLPLFGMVTRIFKQKGFDILLPVLDNILAKVQLQVVILGTGQKDIEEQLKNLAQKYPAKIKVVLGFDLALAQQIYAAADFFLMPSLFEPCGLGQMIAMRYGTLPIVRATGGLKDTVNNKNGFVFKGYSQKQLGKIITKALGVYVKPSRLKNMIKRGMQGDFSWHRSAQEYKKIYNQLCK